MMKTISQCLALCLLLTVALAASAATEAYKCTAEDGSISYLDKKPTTGCVTVEIVRINVGKGSNVQHQGKSTADNQGNENDPEYDKEVAERKEKAAEACESQRKNLEKLKNNAHIMIKDETGEERVLSTEEHQKKIDDIEKYLQDFCS